MSTTSNSHSNAQLSSISFSQTSVVSGNAVIGTVHLTSAATKAATVTLALNNSSDPCTIPASVVVPVGASSANFTIQTHAVTKTFTETIWGNFGVTEHASFHMTPASIVAVPAITSAKTANGTVGSTFSFEITASNSPVSYGATGLPSGLSVNSATGLISGTPASAATASVTVSATNTSGTGTATLTLTIAAAASPVITSATTASATVGSAFSYQITATNSPSSFKATGLPAGLSLSSTGLISGTPSAAGISTVALSATNAGGTGTATLQLTVNSVEGIPVITSATAISGTVGSAFTFEITATNSPTSYGATGLPAGLSVNTTSGVISGKPTVAGSSSATLSATNSGGTGTSPLLISIAAAPVVAPVITSAGTASGVVGTAFSYQITANNSPTSFNATGLPTGLSVNTASGLISGTPSAAAADSVTLSASNSSGTGTQMLSLTISAQASGSLAASLGTPSFSDLFNYTSASESSFLANWVPQLYSASNYAGAGSNVTMQASNITFPINANTGTPCLCLTLNQTSSSASNGGEILSAASLFKSTGFGGYGTYEFCARFGSTSSTPTGSGSAVSGGVSSTFLLSQSNSGGSGYIEMDIPEVEGQHATWAEYDTWYNSDSGGNTQPSGGNFISQGAGSDSYLNVPTLVTGFNYYGIVWAAGKISYYLNGVLQGTNTSNVPAATTVAGNIPGLDINHYGCNSSDWGGKATVGTSRYCYVESVKFWKA